MYEKFFVNFSVIILCPVFVLSNLKTFKNPPQKKLKPKNLFFRLLSSRE